MALAEPLSVESDKWQAAFGWKGHRRWAKVERLRRTIVYAGWTANRVPWNGVKSRGAAHLEQNLFQCFDTRCAAKGDTIDLWAVLHKKDVRAAALELVQTFHREPAPRIPTPHRPRHG